MIYEYNIIWVWSKSVQQCPVVVAPVYVWDTSERVLGATRTPGGGGETLAACSTPKLDETVGWTERLKK